MRHACCGRLSVPRTADSDVTSTKPQSELPDLIKIPACTVRDVAHGVGLFATRDIAEASTILAVEGRLQPYPTRYSIQIDAALHVDADASLPDHEMRVRHPWRFLNHSCEPNAAVDGRRLVALRAIGAGEQITFDYTTTEADMAEPFDCGCGARGCLGHVRGFLHLAGTAKRARAHRLAPHLRSHLDGTV